MKSTILAAALALTGCASGINSTGVQPASPDQVTSCRYLDDVLGTSIFYGLFASAGGDNARAQALDKARAIGATHIVWNAPTARYGSTDVSGKAYRCT